MHAYNVNQGTYDFYHSELDEFDTQAIRFKPESLDNLVKLTKFNKRELKLMYRGFKQLCPAGVVKEDKFMLIYAQFFPRGAETNGYARFVFQTFDVQKKHEITFTEFVIGLSVLTRGTIDEKLRWIFTLYDINGDGIITKDELNKIINSVNDLMGKFALRTSQTDAGEANRAAARELAADRTAANTNTPRPVFGSVGGSGATRQQQLLQASQQQTLSNLTQSNLSNEEQAENLFKKFDLNNDGIITLDEFIEACHKLATLIGASGLTANTTTSYRLFRTTSAMAKNEEWKSATSVYDFTVKDIDNQDVKLDKYKGKVLLIVNVASKCGFTKSNYKELNELYAKHKDQGLAILGFPCNQFGHQEPGCDVDIKEFIKKNGVEWDIFAKVDVNGENAIPLYSWLKHKSPGTLIDAIKWNFTKFLVDKQGQPVARYAPNKNPLEFEKEIVAELEKK